MLIQPYAEGWLDQLRLRHSILEAGRQIFMLIDGAFIPGLHGQIDQDEKRLLFEALPGCCNQTKDVSPFITAFEPTHKRLMKLLAHCDRWPMVSAIETSESIDALNARLSAWCVVYADGQRFNFRFPDTRRLPAILSVLDEVQLSQFVGPAVSWLYVSRDGQWVDIAMKGLAVPVASDPNLSRNQFARLVEDSGADEVLSLLNQRGRPVYLKPFESHGLVAMAIDAARTAEGLNDQEMIGWCEWFWQHGKLGHENYATVALSAWLDRSGGDDV
jgi:hypothetical protein